MGLSQRRICDGLRTPGGRLSAGARRKPGILRSDSRSFNLAHGDLLEFNSGKRCNEPAIQLASGNDNWHDQRPARPSCLVARPMSPLRSASAGSAVFRRGPWIDCAAPMPCRAFSRSFGDEFPERCPMDAPNAGDDNWLHCDARHGIVHPMSVRTHAAEGWTAWFRRPVSTGRGRDSLFGGKWRRD